MHAGYMELPVGQGQDWGHCYAAVFERSSQSTCYDVVLHMARHETNPLVVAVFLRSTWAAQGFCDDAANQMIGLRGMCRRSCQDCRSCDSLRPVRPQGTDSKVASSMPSLKAYMDCIYANMHSLRQEWSEAARGPGVRKARNAIRRDMRFQAANGLTTGHSAPSKQQSSWSTVW